MARSLTATRVVAALKPRVHLRETLVIFQAPPYGVIPLRGTGIEIHLATKERLADLGWFHTPQELQLFADFLDAGDVGYLAYIDGRCVHRTWIVSGPAEIREHWSQRRVIGREQSFVHYCLTATEARGRGVFPTVLTRIASDQRSRRTTMAIASDNYPSQQAATKASWAPVERVTFSVDFGFKRQRRAAVPR